MVEHVSDFKMPEKIVSRLLKDALPEDVTVSKEAKNVACRSASVFILQLSILAAEKADLNRKRTLDNKDIIAAATELGLGEYAPQLVRFGAQRKRNAKRKVTNIQKNRSKRASSASNLELQRSFNATNNIEVDSTNSNANISENQNEETMGDHHVDDEQDQTMNRMEEDDSESPSLDNGESIAESRMRLTSND